MNQIKVLYSGTVQGVGFRFTVESIARKFKVTGYVKNLDDGTVEVVAEGDDFKTEDFLNAISESPLKHYITDTKIKRSVAEDLFKRFEITF